MAIINREGGGYPDASNRKPDLLKDGARHTVVPGWADCAQYGPLPTVVLVRGRSRARGFTVALCNPREDPPVQVVQPTVSETRSGD